MANFLIAFGKTIKTEGGYSNVREDRGNWTGGKIGSGVLVGTKYGISAPVLMAHLGRLPTVDEMKNLSRDTVQKIYKSNYWDIMRGDEIVTQFLADKIFDNCVNFGVAGGIKILQESLTIKATGKMDDVTLNKLNQNRKA